MINFHNPNSSSSSKRYVAVKPSKPDANAASPYSTIPSPHDAKVSNILKPLGWHVNNGVITKLEPDEVVNYFTPSIETVLGVASELLALSENKSSTEKAFYCCINQLSSKPCNQDMNFQFISKLCKIADSNWHSLSYNLDPDWRHDDIFNVYFAPLLQDQNLHKLLEIKGTLKVSLLALLAMIFKASKDAPQSLNDEQLKNITKFFREVITTELETFSNSKKPMVYILFIFFGSKILSKFPGLNFKDKSEIILQALVHHKESIEKSGFLALTAMMLDTLYDDIHGCIIDHMNNKSNIGGFSDRGFHREQLTLDFPGTWPADDQETIKKDNGYIKAYRFFNETKFKEPPQNVEFGKILDSFNKHNFYAIANISYQLLNLQTCRNIQYYNHDIDKQLEILFSIWKYLSDENLDSDTKDIYRDASKSFLMLISFNIHMKAMNAKDSAMVKKVYANLFKKILELKINFSKVDLNEYIWRLFSAIESETSERTWYSSMSLEVLRQFANNQSDIYIMYKNSAISEYFTDKNVIDYKFKLTADISIANLVDIDDMFNMMMQVKMIIEPQSVIDADEDVNLDHTIDSMEDITL